MTDLRERIDRIFAESARRKALEQADEPFPRRLPAQLAYHLVRLDCDDPTVRAAQEALLPLAGLFHRTDVTPKHDKES